MGPKSGDWEGDAIARCRQGDTEAFGLIVDHYRNWVFGHVYRWVDRKEKAEELAQEVFVKAFSQLRNFREQASFSTWLFQIMKNHCRDYWRSKEYRQGITESLDDLKRQPVLSAEAESRVSEQEESLKIRRALNSLPEIYQEALRLRYLSEMSYEEMAAALNKKTSNLKMRVARGLELLKNKLKEPSP